MPETSSRQPGRPRKTTTPAATTEPAVVPEVEAPITIASQVPPEILAELEALRKRVAEQETAKVDQPTEKNEEGTKFLIHFVADGLTLLGKIWYTGQELEFDTSNQAYKDACDMYGDSILDLRNDPREQERRLGKEYFREGPWTGKSYADIEFERLRALASEENINLPTRDDLRALDEKERGRKRQAEALTPVRGAPRPKGY